MESACTVLFPGDQVEAGSNPFSPNNIGAPGWPQCFADDSCIPDHAPHTTQRACLPGQAFRPVLAMWANGFDAAASETLAKPPRPVPTVTTCKLSLGSGGCRSSMRDMAVPPVYDPFV